MKKKTKKLILIIFLLLGAVAAATVFFVLSAITPEKESVIVYENKVVETIDAQLKDLPIEQIRTKEPLIMEKSIEEIQSAIAKNDLTYTELTAFYLDRIKRFDKAKNGINSVIEINPKAIADAQALDKEKLSEKDPMYGIPVLLKDNINTKDMPTSAGTYALKDFQPSEDAPLVDALRKNKAIILGKANLSELANYFSLKMPSGYSSKLGQTHNPFNPVALSPEGSSSGSGAAVAANLSAVALGTETSGSIIAPASIHSIVGFKPTKDLINGEGVLPLAKTMDTVGPMAKTVKDAVALFNASVSDPGKKITLTYDAQSIAKKRIGVLKTDGSEKVVEVLKKVGAEPVELDFDLKLDTNFILLQDFKNNYADYAKKYNAPIKTLADLVKFNQQDLDRRAKYGQALLEDAAEADSNDRAKVEGIVKEDQERIQKLITDHKLDALAFRDNGAAEVPAIAGYPSITVPIGESDKKSPTGATFFGLGNEDEKIVNLAYAFEQATKMRLIPEKYKEVVGK